MRRPRELLAGAIRFYRRRMSPGTPPSCRFRPTCSQYALEAVTRHGAAKGALLSLWRILRCNPFGKGGYDPVPHMGMWRPQARFLLFAPLGVKGKRKRPEFPGETPRAEQGRPPTIF